MRSAIRISHPDAHARAPQRNPAYGCSGCPRQQDNVHTHCQESDFAAAFGEKYVMDDERTLHYRYERNGRGLWHVLRTIGEAPAIRTEALPA